MTNDHDFEPGRAIMNLTFLARQGGFHKGGRLKCSKTTLWRRSKGRNLIRLPEVQTFEVIELCVEFIQRPFQSEKVENQGVIRNFCLEHRSAN
jgi:hypothetical protein